MTQSKKLVVPTIEQQLVGYIEKAKRELDDLQKAVVDKKAQIVALQDTLVSLCPDTAHQPHRHIDEV